MGGRAVISKGPARAKRRAPSLDTEGLTPVRPEVSHNSPRSQTARLMRGLQAGRAHWLAELEDLTVLSREQRARALEQRAAELAKERQAEWLGSAFETLDARGRATDAGRVARNDRGRAVGSPAFERHVCAETECAPAPASRWHLSRAEGERTRFERVANCLTQTSYVHLSCRHCGDQTVIDAGCGSSWFCHRCRRRNADRFRDKFVRRAGGLINAARRAGMMHKYFGKHLLTRERRDYLKANLINPKTGKPITSPLRFAQRFMTVTAPHLGTVEQRVDIMKLAMPRFAELLRAALLKM